MAIDWLLERMAQWPDQAAIVWQDERFSYSDLLRRVRQWLADLNTHDISPGQVVTIEGDYSPNAVSLMLALIHHDCIVVPLTASVEAQRAEFLEIAEVQVVITIAADDSWQIERRPVLAQNELTRRLIDQGLPGLVLFSSGSTGKSKAALHNFTALLEKFKLPRHSRCALTFLLLDHIGGVNTLFYSLANGGTVVSVANRDPEVVCAAIARHQVQTLPTSPTFLNLLLISRAYQRHNLSSLILITYGTEVMPESTLQHMHELFPNVQLLQTYGLSELGILRSKSKDSGSLWVKVGGEGFETKIVDNTLWVRAQSAMLGYLNAPSPFDAEGWMNTQDVVEVDGEYIRILGRRTDIINVGGQKVYPAEVESVLLQMENVRDVAVRGEANPIVGHIVTARFNLFESEEPAAFRKRVRVFCSERLASYKVPVKIEITGQDQYSARYKKMRTA